MATEQHIDLFREAFPATFDGKPARLQVFKAGKWKHPTYGEIEVKPEDLTNIVKNFESTSRAVVLDYDHGTDTGETPEERKAAGWLRNLAVEGDSLWGDFELTDDAYKYVKKGEYRFFSPTWVSNFANKETGQDQGMTLLRGALTNNPFIDGMHPAVALSERAADMIRDAKEKSEATHEKQEEQKREVEAKRIGRPVFLVEPGALKVKTEEVNA